jgi:hypothetical protein
VGDHIDIWESGSGVAGVAIAGISARLVEADEMERESPACLDSGEEMEKPHRTIDDIHATMSSMELERDRL